MLIKKGNLCYTWLWQRVFTLSAVQWNISVCASPTWVVSRYWPFMLNSLCPVSRCTFVLGSQMSNAVQIRKKGVKKTPQLSSSGDQKCLGTDTGDESGLSVSMLQLLAIISPIFTCWHENASDLLPASTSTAVPPSKAHDGQTRRVPKALPGRKFIDHLFIQYKKKIYNWPVWASSHWFANPALVGQALMVPCSASL